MFIKLKPDGSGWDSYLVDFDRGVVIASKSGVTRISAIQNWLHIEVTESAPEILALISGGAGDEAVTEVTSEVAVAAWEAYRASSSTEYGRVMDAVLAALRARAAS